MVFDRGWRGRVDKAIDLRRFCSLDIISRLAERTSSLTLAESSDKKGVSQKMSAEPAVELESHSSPSPSHKIIPNDNNNNNSIYMTLKYLSTTRMKVGSN